MGRHSMADTTSADTASPDTTPGGMSTDTVTPAPNALELRGLRKTFRTGLFGRGRRVQALDGLDLTVPAGTVHALLGPNGAGKTTTVRAVATLMKPDEGTVLVDGVDAIADPGAARKIIGVSGQYAAVDGNLTGFENLRMVGQLYGLSRAEASGRARELIADLALQDAADRPMRTYSGGMRRRLDLAGALINRPSLVILDEPTTGLDPRGRRQMWEVITEQVAGGATVLLTTQYLEEADALADEITVIDHGSIRAQGSAAALKASTGASILTIEVRSDDGHHDELVATTLAEVGLGMPERLDDPDRTDAPLAEQTAAGVTKWSVPVDEGTRSAVSAVRALDAVGIDVVDATVATPTLDDVFLALTERNTQASDGGSDRSAGAQATADAETTVIPRVSDADPDLSHAPTTRSDRLHAH
ncbi:ABC transporter ATP-binding protein [Gordonia sp. HS-NH1]|uniref:ABC transporter ATP-binding protein n=1 Tax=Gordonia sp. HS-NH1 TaxID=1435068 RepID=UPI000A6C8D42